MLVEILNLYVESLFTIAKTHLLRNVIDKIIYHQSSNNDFSCCFEKDRMRNSISWL